MIKLIDLIEKQGIDRDDDGDIDSKDWAISRDIAIKKRLQKEGEDHEVAMAQNSLKAIAKAAMELSNKIGGMERDIPGWIQDHITNAENYIEQAAQGFHELNEGRAIASNYQLTEKQFDVLKNFGVKVSTNGNELYFPELLYIDLSKNKADSKFKKEFYDTVPSSDQYLVSQVMTAIKKSINPGSNVKIGDKKYFILKGNMTKNGNFNFDNPYRTKDNG
jgi:hypothetical protein